MNRYLFTIIFLFYSITNIAQTFVTTQDINIRKDAGTKYEILGIIPADSKIQVIEIKGKWGKVNFEGNEGYISTKFLKNSVSDIENSKTNSTESSGSSLSIIKFGLIILVVFLLIRFTIFKIFFTTLFPGLSSLLVGEYQCTKCGKRIIGRDKKSCPNGGIHSWYKV